MKTVIAYSDIENVELKNNDMIRISFNKPINNKKFTNIKLSKEIKYPQKIIDKMISAINSNNWKKNMK